MRTRAALATLAAAFVMAAIPGWAAETNAADVLKKVSAAARNTTTMQASYVMSLKMKLGDQDFSMDIPIELASQKPNKMRMEMKGDLANVLIVSDGIKLYQYLPGLKQVKISDAPKDLNQAPADVSSRLKSLGLGILTGAQSDEAIAAMAKGAKFNGVKKMDGRETYAIELNLPTIGPAKVWVGTKDYQFYRLELNLDLASVMGEASPPARTILVAKQIKIDQPIAPEVFDFKVPEGVTVVKDFDLSPAPEPKSPGQ